MLLCWLTILAFTKYPLNPPDPYDTTIKKTLNRFCQEVKKENKAVLFGSGSRLELDGTEQWSYAFEQYGKVDVTQARRIYLRLIDKMIRTVNQDPKMQAFLKERPFDWHNADIGLIFLKEDHHFAQDPYVAGVKLIKGKVYYSKSIDKYSPLQDLYEEPYEEAVYIVQEEERLQKQAAN